jgi:hypothetical protein
MKKLLILCECRESESIAESALSYARRELGAAVAYFGTDHAAEHLVEGKPDVVVYWATLNRERMLSDETLRWIKSRSRLVLWCSESSSPNYAELLRHYRYENLFDLSVGTDGYRVASYGQELIDYATLWPVDPIWYQALDRYDHYKDIDLGFPGSIGDDRKPLIQSFGDALTVRERKAGNAPEFDAYGSYAAWLMRCRAVVNDSTLDGGHAVKNRVIEAGYAGCLLFEMADSPLERWGFVAGHDYMAYDPARPESVVAVTQMPEFPDIAATFGARLREKVRQFHPAKFWAKVLGDAT